MITRLVMHPIAFKGAKFHEFVTGNLDINLFIFYDPVLLIDISIPAKHEESEYNVILRILEVQ